MEDQNYILFEDYLTEVLSKDEVTGFNIRLKNDEEFHQAFITYKECSTYLEHKIKKQKASTEFKNNLTAISNKHFEAQSTSTKIVKFTPWHYGIAASFALLLGVFLFNPFSNPTYKNFANYDTISLTVRGSNDDNLAKAEHAFNTKNFEEAESYFTLLLDQEGTNKELQLYAGIVSIELNKFDQADSILTILSEEPSAYNSKATWYFALSKLKQKEYSNCLNILKTIPEGSDDFERAQILIKKLD